MSDGWFAQVGQAGLNKNGEELCGDKVHVRRTEESTVVVMADGLGSGVKANILATLTSKIAGDMLRMGSDIDDVVDTLTQTLPVCKVRGVAYSTFTILQMFHDGRVYVVEYDNPPTFLFRDGVLVALPAEERVVNEKIIKESRFTISERDVLVMVSDGAVHAGVGGVLNLGWQWSHIARYLEGLVGRIRNPDTLAHRLAQACNDLYESKPGDDTTVVCVTFRRPTPVALLIGPPSNRSDDPAFVEAWQQHAGRKVICGGTTAQIAAGVGGQTLQAGFWESGSDPEVPPLSHMDGVDLITEGVLTLRKVLSLLQAYQQHTLDPSRLERSDGASRLAKLLLQEATRVHFYVGTAINPAHQNPDFPQDLNIKLRIVREMNQILQAMDLPTTLTFY